MSEKIYETIHIKYDPISSPDFGTDVVHQCAEAKEITARQGDAVAARLGFQSVEVTELGRHYLLCPDCRTKERKSCAL